MEKKKVVAYIGAVNNEDQKKAIDLFLSHNDYNLMETFEETEEILNNINKTVLDKAIKECKLTNSALIVSGLNAFPRKISGISNVIEEIEVIFCSLPNADKFITHLLATLYEANQI